MQKVNEQDFSPEESLKLIHSMIEQSKNSISDRSHYFLLWGWAAMIGCLVQYYLKVIINYPQHYYAWFITPVALCIHFIFVYRDTKREKTRTFVNEASVYLWISIGLSFLVLPFVFSKIGWQYCYPIYILLYAIGTYVSGCMIRFKPLIIGGITCFLLVIITSFLDFDSQILVTAFAILISYIIPGHLLRMQYKKSQQ